MRSAIKHLRFGLVLVAGIFVIAIFIFFSYILPLPPDAGFPTLVVGGFIAGFVIGALSKDLLKGIFGGLLSGVFGSIVGSVIVYLCQGYYSVAIEEGLKQGYWIGRWLWVPAVIGSALGTLVTKKGIGR